VLTHSVDHKVSIFKKSGDLVATINILDAPEIKETAWIYNIEDIKDNLLLIIVDTGGFNSNHKMCILDIETASMKFSKDIPFVSRCFFKNGKIHAFTDKGVIIYNMDGEIITEIPEAKKFPANIRRESFKSRENKIIWVDDTWDVYFNILDTSNNELTSNLLLNKCDCECGFAQYYYNNFYNVIIYNDKNDIAIRHIVMLSNNADVLFEYEYHSPDNIWIHGVVGSKLILSRNQKFFSLDFTNSEETSINYEGYVDYFDPGYKICINVDTNGIMTARHLDIDSSMSLSFAVSSNEMKIGNINYKMDTAPTIVNDRTLLPARYVTEPLGGGVTWDGYEKKVVCKLADKTVEFWIGKPVAKINGVEVQIDPNNLDVVPTIINDRTMVPMRFLAESLGCEVEWIYKTKEIILTYDSKQF